MKGNQTYKEMYFRVRKYGESDCCTVIALCAVTGLSFKRSLHKLKKLGRQDRKGTWMHYEAIRREGYDLIRTPRGEGLTLSKFAEIYNQGRYIVYTRAHAIGIVDGWISDHCNEEILGHKSRRIVVYAHKVVAGNNTPEMKTRSQVQKFIHFGDIK